jgi:DNA-binding HxlR family transcriptional regulator
MRRKSFADLQCPIARTVDELGDAWSFLILRHAFLGAARFQDFEEQLGIPPTTLARRLESLRAAGLLERRRYHARPLRESYELTDKGRDFLPVLLALSAWGNRWLATEGVAIECADPESGRTVVPLVVDRSSGRPLRAGEVALKAGPAARRELRRALDPPVVLGVRDASPDLAAHGGENKTKRSKRKGVRI